MLTHSPLLFPDLHQPGTLALRPMQISGAVTPIEDADGGINIVVVSESDSGVLCVIVAYLDMLEGDKNVVYWDDVAVFTRTVEPGEKDRHLFFYLPKELFTPGLHECFYELTRFGATAPDDPSVLSLFRVKLTSPGGRDKEPHLPDGHSELHIAQLPQDIIDQGVIDADWAKKGVPLTVRAYPEITLRDTILMRWGSHTLAPHLVTQAQAEGKDPIVIVAKQEDILAGGDSAALEIKYDPHDDVWNWSSRHSKRTRIAVDAGAWRLPAPIIKESVNGIITIINLNQKDVTVQVHIQGSDFALNDSVKMTWVGTPFSSKPLIHTESRTVANIPSVMDFAVPYAQVRAIAMGRADASYVLTKADGSLPLSSKREFADVVGDVSMPDAPTIVELLGDILESDRPYATVRITYLTIAKGDLVAGHWIGEKSNGQPYVHEFTHTVTDNEAKEGFFTAYVDKEHIIVLDKGKLDLWYTVSYDETELYGVRESEHLLVKVQAVTATLPRPEVEEADKDKDVLDPSKVFDVVHISIENPPTKKHDILTWYWQATHPLGSISDWVPITSPSAGKPLRFRVPANFVTISIGQYVRVRYSLKHASTGLYSHSAALNLLIGSLVGELPAPQVKQAPNAVLKAMDGLNGVDVNVSYGSMNPALDIIPLHWIGTPGAGTSNDLELPGHSSGSVGFHLPPTVIGPNINKTVDVKYFVRRYGHETESESLGLRVTGFDDPENDLPRPQVPESDDNRVLDLRTFNGNATILVAKWHYIALKQRLWLRLEGKTAVGSDHIIRMLDGVEITPAQFSSGLNEVLLRSELMKLGHSTPANVICKVSFDGSAEEVDAIEFPGLPLTIRTLYDWLTPKITHVTDANGEVTEGGETFFEQVTVEGSATRDETVEIFDGSTSHGNADVGADGVWRKTLLNLQIKDYHITAHALYPADPVSSLIRAFTVMAAVPPTITDITDSKGSVPHNGTTFDTSVTITGKASPGQTVQLYDGAIAVAPVTNVDANGDWSKTFTGLSVAPHNIKAQALYGAQPESAVRSLTVAVASAPSITNVTDSKGSVPHNGTTFDTSVTVTGKASPGQTVQLYDGTTPVAPVTNVDANGDWSKTFTGLSVAPHNIKAKALYGAQPESAVRIFTVAVHTAPSLDSVRDSRGELPNNGATTDTSVSLQGRVTPLHDVQIYDGNTPKHIATALNTGIWTTTLAVGLGGHTITTRALTTGQTSNPRSFTVNSPIPPLTINPATMSLNAWHFRDNDTPTNPPAGAFGDRSASGGVLPYRYASSNPNVAEVNATNGRVISKGNGSATITVTDNANQTASYTVTTSNVDRLFGTGHFNTYTVCANTAANMGGRIPSLAEWRAVISNYSGRRTIERWCWASDSGGIGKRMVIFPATGQADTRLDIGIGGGTADGFGVRRA
ncbi:Ig-like domain-containing protein [Pseudomonas sp. stari2]|uniref:Ig-like domain-containing protein n=1 Tax=Pseudomonas sp. Stari2 TaxID=2954814 RepID=UPI00345D6C8C